MIEETILTKNGAVADFFSASDEYENTIHIEIDPGWLWDEKDLKELITKLKEIRKQLKNNDEELRKVVTEPVAFEPVPVEQTYPFSFIINSKEGGKPYIDNTYMNSQPKETAFIYSFNDDGDLVVEEVDIGPLDDEWCPLCETDKKRCCE